VRTNASLGCFWYVRGACTTFHSGGTSNVHQSEIGREPTGSLRRASTIAPSISMGISASYDGAFSQGYAHRAATAIHLAI